MPTLIENGTRASVRNSGSEKGLLMLTSDRATVGLFASCPGIEQIRGLELGELIRRFRFGVQNFDARFSQLTAEQVDRAFLPDAGVGRWPARVVVGHIADADLAYVHRARRAVAEESPVFSPWDENAFIDSGLYRHSRLPGHPSPMIGGHIAVIHTLRMWTAEWLDTLTDAQWQRRGLHQEHGPISVHDIVVIATWHIEHHARFLNMKIERMLGPAPQQSVPTGKCGSSCGCHK